MTDKLVTSLQFPWALVRVQGNGQPGRRPPSAMAWLEFDNGESFDGHLLYADRSGCWARRYKHTKTIPKADVLHVFKMPQRFMPTLSTVKAAKRALPLIAADAS